MEYYILDGTLAKIEPSILAWGKWYESADRLVAHTQLEHATVSTVFLGVDHTFIGIGDPLLFETMVFLKDGGYGQVARYFTWGEAEHGHKQIVDVIKQEESDMEKLSIDLIQSLLTNSKNHI